MPREIASVRSLDGAFRSACVELIRTVPLAKALAAAASAASAT